MNQCGCNVIDIESISVAGTSLTLVANPSIAVVNKRCYTLRICQHLPIVGESGTESVSIKVGEKTYPVLDWRGNTLRAGYLHGGRRYRVIFGDDANHFLVLDRDLCCFVYNPNATVPDGG